VNICRILQSHIHGDKYAQIITSLGHIRSVDLVQSIISSHSLPLTIKSWLYLFPHLEHVSLSFHLLDLSDEEKHDVVTEFATQIAADQPMMKTLSTGFSLAVNLDDLQRMPGFKV